MVCTLYFKVTVNRALRKTGQENIAVFCHIFLKVKVTVVNLHNTVFLENILYVLGTWNNKFTLSNIMSDWVLIFINRLDMVLTCL